MLLEWWRRLRANCAPQGIGAAVVDDTVRDAMLGLEPKDFDAAPSTIPHHAWESLTEPPRDRRQRAASDEPRVRLTFKVYGRPPRTSTGRA
jgi:tRNA nucleotidyltransferase/poly(A) polymerase